MPKMGRYRSPDLQIWGFLPFGEKVSDFFNVTVGDIQAQVILHDDVTRWLSTAYEVVCGNMFYVDKCIFVNTE